MSQQAKFIIIAHKLKVPKILGADISNKNVLECQGADNDVLVYKAPLSIAREVKKMTILDAIDYLEKESLRCNYTTTYATNFREAGI